jgi:two-component system sensor histidine kinase KdpD
VGHIVIGSPGPLPLWKKWLGHENVVERLAEKAGGITVVVLDTRRYESTSTRGPADFPEDNPMSPEPGGNGQRIPSISGR